MENHGSMKKIIQKYSKNPLTYMIQVLCLRFNVNKSISLNIGSCLFENGLIFTGKFTDVAEAQFQIFFGVCNCDFYLFQTLYKLNSVLLV